jgi:hypothetical protein
MPIRIGKHNGIERERGGRRDKRRGGEAPASWN